VRVVRLALIGPDVFDILWRGADLAGCVAAGCS